jgi:predicted nucleic acid-binding protein
LTPRRLPVLLDTTVLIDVLRGAPAAQRVLGLRSDGLPYICAINVEEIWRGLRAGEEPAAAQLIGALRLAELGREQAEVAGVWRRDHAARGVTLSQADCLIAAAAASVGARVATGNPKDFPMEGVEVEHWPAGS